MGRSSLQVNLCQKLLFLHQLTQNMTTDCSLNYKFNTWRFEALHIGRTCCVQKFFDIQNNFCTQHVLQKEDILTKIYLYQTGVPNNKYHLQIFPKMYYNFKKSRKSKILSDNVLVLCRILVFESNVLTNFLALQIAASVSLKSGRLFTLDLLYWEGALGFTEISLRSI